MWTCKYCNTTFHEFKTSQKANHTRWCDRNPNAIEIRKNAAAQEAAAKTFNEKLGEFKEYSVNCFKCDSSIIVKERTKQHPLKESYFCSRKCANSHQVSDTTKNKIKQSVDRFFEATKDERLAANKKYSKICKTCNCEFELTYLSRKRSYCSEKCKKNRILPSKTNKRTNESLQEYRRLCAFKFNLADYPNEFDFDLIREYGWYKPKNKGNNLNGVSRDHLISVRYGFDNKIDPKILSHPANCKLMQHNNNVSKYTTCELSLEQLLERIDQWNEKYPLTKD